MVEVASRAMSHARRQGAASQTRGRAIAGLKPTPGGVPFLATSATDGLECRELPASASLAALSASRGEPARLLARSLEQVSAWRGFAGSVRRSHGRGAAYLWPRSDDPDASV